MSELPQQERRQKMPGAPQGGDHGKKPPPAPTFSWKGVLVLLLLGWLLWSMLGDGAPGREVPYSEFRAKVAAGQVRDLTLRSDAIVGEIQESPKSGEKSSGGGKPAAAAAEPTWVKFHTLRVEDRTLVEDLDKAKVKYSGAAGNPFGGLLLLWLLPLMLLPLLLLFLMRGRGAGGPMGSPFGFGRSRARMVADKDTGVRFDDVAGCDEAKADLAEVVTFLKHPERFERLGARVPKGVLLLGPPGTGKTLLARAVAGEAGVPFYSISGSEFVEMFVGVGAARVRDLFEQAKKNAPCIVFVDEIDAIGRSRGVHMGNVNDEREQTLNQLLVELDGFEPNSGVILLAATNRPEVLDRALLRPGRFDRQVVLDAPDVQGREAILKVHARGKPLAKDVDLASIARGTPGFAGADLANALNEAALNASRRGADRIGQRDLEDAVEKIVAGPERQSRRLRDLERRRVAFHESGHAVAAAFLEHADPVHKISIVPRGRAALGYTMQLPLEEQMLLTRAELEDRVVGLLGGRAAEEEVFGDVSTGASDDLQRATSMVRQMVCVYGMGEAAGLMRCATDPESPFMRNGLHGQLQRDCSEEMARQIDAEVKGLLDRHYGRARAILREHRDALDRVAATLLERERLEGPEFMKLIDTQDTGAQDTPAEDAAARGAKPS